MGQTDRTALSQTEPCPEQRIVTGTAQSGIITNKQTNKNNFFMGMQTVSTEAQFSAVRESVQLGSALSGTTFSSKSALPSTAKEKKMV